MKITKQKSRAKKANGEFDFKVFKLQDGPCNERRRQMP